MTGLREDRIDVCGNERKWVRKEVGFGSGTPFL